MATIKKGLKKAQVGKTLKKIADTKLKDVPSKAERVIKKGVKKVKDKVENATVRDAVNIGTSGLSGLAEDAYKALTRKSGGPVKKAKSGLGMKSVKSGYDNNSGVTRADFVAIGKGTAKSGTKMKKAMSGYGGKAASMVPMKSGGKMAKCKYGCK
jgi:hypothetical protein